jgi:hypothetical protein
MLYLIRPLLLRSGKEKHNRGNRPSSAPRLTSLIFPTTTAEHFQFLSSESFSHFLTLINHPLDHLLLTVLISEKNANNYALTPLSKIPIFPY